MLNKMTSTNILVSIFDAILLIVCIILACIAYDVASDGFGTALNMKASADIKAVETVLDLRYPGEWKIKNNVLYKGDQCFEYLTNELDVLKQMTGDNISIFREDIRVGNTFIEGDSPRAINEKAPDNVVKAVLVNNQAFEDKVNFDGKHYFAAYHAIKDNAGNNIGMISVAIPTAEIEKLQTNFVIKMCCILISLLILIGVAFFIALRKAFAIVDQMEKQVKEKNKK